VHRLWVMVWHAKFLVKRAAAWGGEAKLDLTTGRRAKNDGSGCERNRNRNRKRQKKEG